MPGIVCKLVHFARRSLNNYDNQNFGHEFQRQVGYTGKGAEGMDDKPADDAGENRRGHIEKHFIGIHTDAHHAGHIFIFIDGRHAHADARADRPVAHEQIKEHQDKRQIVVGDIVPGDFLKCQQRTHADQSDFAAEDVAPDVGDIEKGKRQDQCDQREV